MLRAGIDSDGVDVTIPEGKIHARNLPSRYGNVWHVNSAKTNSGNGKTWNKAFKTITEGYAAASAGDTILITGSFTAEAAINCAKAGVRFVGAGSTSNMALWTSAADAKSLTISAADVLVENIRFRPPAYSAGVPAAIYLTTGANQFTLRGCRFQGKAASWYAVLTDGSGANVRIEGNEFFYMNTATYGTAIMGTGYAASEPSGWMVVNNLFHSNINHIVCRMRQSFIIGNYFGAGGLAADASNSATLTVLGVDIHGAVAGNNVVTQNFMGSLYHQACYYGGTDDSWAGNFCTDRSHATQVDATTGISILAPAA
jgi:hypothetical protein